MKNTIENTLMKKYTYFDGHVTKELPDYIQNYLNNITEFVYN